MRWVDPRRVVARSGRLLALFLAALLLAASLSAPWLVRAASFDPSVCDPALLLNGVAPLSALTAATGNGASDTILPTGLPDRPIP